MYTDFEVEQGILDLASSNKDGNSIKGLILLYRFVLFFGRG
jgi:hypothetical protein